MMGQRSLLPSPEVSVIVVIRNGERYIAQALSSILEQTHPAGEVIVVDGQSTDRTAEILSGFPGLRQVEQPGKGLADARNLGLACAQGKLIAFLDHDDYWTLDKLALQVELLAQHPELDFVTGLVHFFCDAGEPVRPGFPAGALNQDHAGQTPGTLLARRPVFEKVGEFDPRLKIACDADWFVRAADCGAAWQVVPRPLLYKRIHPHNLSAQAGLYQKEWLSVLRRSVQRKQAQKG